MDTSMLDGVIAFSADLHYCACWLVSASEKKTDLRHGTSFVVPVMVVVLEWYSPFGQVA